MTPPMVEPGGGATRALLVHSYAVAGGASAPWPASRTVPLPPPGEHRRRARLPGLTASLAERALDETTPPPDTAVMIGTALGSLTETAAFVENMLRHDEEMPRPRAFSASVHNAAASQLARRLGAQGECQTYTHGALSFFQACFAASHAGGASRLLVGGVDECSPYVQRATERCAAAPMTEGGAMFWCAPRPATAATPEGSSSASPATTLASLRVLAQGRPRDARAWFEHHLGAAEVEGVLWPFESPLRRELGGAPTTEHTGHHLSAAATATALAIALLAGELSEESRASLAATNARSSLVTTPPQQWRSLGVAVITSSGETGLLQVRSPS